MKTNLSKTSGAMRLAPRLAFHAPGTEMKAENLRGEYRVNPQGIDEPRPQLTWPDESNEHGARQAAYQILVAASARHPAKNSGDLGDSGKVAGGRTIIIAGSGRPLASREQCYWKVRAWDQAGRARWCEAASGTTGLLKPDDGKAHYDPVRGRIESEWKRTKNEFELEAEIPANTPAAIYPPAAGLDKITEGGRPLAQAAGLRFRRREAGHAGLAAESGRFHFISKLNR